MFGQNVELIIKTPTWPQRKPSSSELGLTSKWLNTHHQLDVSKILGVAHLIVSVSAKFQLPSWSRSDWKVCVWGGGFQLATMSNLNEVTFELLCVEFSWVTLGFDKNESLMILLVMGKKHLGSWCLGPILCSEGPLVRRSFVPHF